MVTIPWWRISKRARALEIIPDMRETPATQAFLTLSWKRVPLWIKNNKSERGLLKLILIPTLPRFLATSDHIGGGLRVHADADLG